MTTSSTKIALVTGASRGLGRNIAIALACKGVDVIGTYHSKGTYKGKAFDHTGRFTDTWIYQDGKWLCVATHTNLINKN